MRTPTKALPPIEHFYGVLRDDVRRVVAQEPGLPTIEAEEDLRGYLRQTFGAELPAARCCHGHVSPWEVFCDAFFARHSMIILKASRGFGGKTYLLGLLALAEAVVLRANVTILGGSGGQSKRVQKVIDKLWNAPGAPRHLVKGEPGVTTMKFVAGNEIEALMASQRSARGAHPHRLRIDEADELDIRVFDAAMGQTMEGGGTVVPQTTIASTHQNADGAFSEILRRASERGWPVMEYCYLETLKPHGWLDPTEVERKRSEMTAEMWRTEVELQEPSAEGRAIDGEAVERMFDRALGETEGEAGRVEEFEPPTKEGSYATGADWGKSAHYTAIPTLRTDVRPMRFVAFYRDRKKPYHLMTETFNARVRRYGGSACHDGWGVGVGVAEMITVEAEAYTQWQGAARTTLFSEYIAAIEKGDVQSPLSEPWYRAHKYLTNDDLYGKGHPPDEFIGCALAYRAARGAGAVVATRYAGVWGSAR